MELKNLITFSKIASLKSFKKAAEDLCYAQSTITTQIQLLERELNVRLFERIGRSVYLTNEGEIFLNYVEKILSLSNEAKNLLSNPNTHSGTLKIGILESLCINKLPELLKNYHMKYPDADITIKLGLCNDLRTYLNNNIVDLILILDRKNTNPDLITSIFFEEPMMFLASPRHKLAKKKNLTISDISNERLILTENGCSYRNVLESMFRNADLKPNLFLEVESIQAIKTFAISNLGITLLPLMIVKEELSKNQLVALDWVGNKFDMMTQMLYHKDKWISPNMNAYIEMATEHFLTNNS
jgi:DNA-binding transcriptional LysR family regulator